MSGDTRELEPAEAYDLWADSYPAEAHNLLMEMEQKAMLALLPDLAGRVVLDLACGSGRYLQRVSERGASFAFGLDLAPAMLARARAVSGRLVCGDLTSLPIASSTVDVIVCGLAVGHVRDLGGVVREMGRVLRRGGLAVYSDFHPFGMRAGWTRGFRTPAGDQYVVSHHFHLYGDHHTACRSGGLLIEEVREPLIEGPHQWAGCPAVLVIRALRQ